jgi:acyl dehydratase
MKIEKRRRGLNYGSNRVRFTAPVPAGGRVRLRQKLVKVEPVEDNGFRITSEMTMEVEGNTRPAMVAETLGIVYG